MIDQILVPLDRSALAECVLPHVIAMTRALDGRVTLLHVQAPPPKATRLRAVDPLDWRILRAEAQTYLSATQERLRAAGVNADAELVEGDAAEQVVAYARERGIGLIVMSSHGQSGLTGWNISGVVQKVVLRAYTSLMIVRAYEPQPAALGDLRYRRLLVPLDGSPRAEYVLPLAASIARTQDAEVLLAHVVRRPEMPRRMPLSQADGDLADQVVERNRSEAVQYLDEVRSRLDVPRVETRLLIADHVAPALHDLTDQEDVDLVLLSAHGYAGEVRWPYGSVVVSFLAYGSAPLLIVQDVAAEQAEPTRAEIAAQSLGRR